MEILSQLGANQSAFIQFFLFVIAISFLTVVVYNPYFKAYDQRHKLTKGADQVASETQDEAKKLSQVYASRAREINEKLNAIFNTSKAESAKSAGIVIDLAKTAINQTNETARKEIQTQKQNAELQLKDVVQEVSESIVQKMLGAK